MSYNADKDPRAEELQQRSPAGMRATHSAANDESFTRQERATANRHNDHRNPNYKSPENKGLTPESPAPSAFENGPVAKELHNELDQLGISRNDPAAREFLAEANHHLGNASAQLSPTEVRGMVQETLNKIAANGFTHTNMQFDQTEQALNRLREQRGLSASAQPDPIADPQSNSMQAPLTDKKSAPAPSSGNSRRRKDPGLKKSTDVAAAITPIKKDPKTTRDAANNADYNDKPAARQDMALTA